MSESIGGAIEPKDRPDIYIGLVGAAGTDLGRCSGREPASDRKILSGPPWRV